MSSTDAKGIPRVYAAPATAPRDAVQIGIAYSRRSQDSGTGVSEQIQDDAIREVAERLDIDVRHWLPADLDASSFTMERPSFQKALSLLADGKATRLIVAKLNRLTRRRKHWEEVLDLAEAEGWQVVSAEFPDLDLHSDTGRMIAGFFIDQGEREYREKRKDGDNARRNAVLNLGVHGGERPPFGYEFTTRGHDKKGKKLRGPLTPNADAAKVRAAFEARAEGASWTEVVRVLGANSQGSAVQMLANRAYLGEARSGEFVKPGAHPALVDEALFNRANRKKTPRSVSYGERKGSPLGGGILRCGSCGRALTRDTNPRGDLAYKCKNLACNKKVTIQAGRIEPFALDIAKGWHAAQHPDYALSRAVEDAMLPALEDALVVAKEECAAIEASTTLSALRRAEALTLADKAVSEALRAVEDAEAGRGWLGLTPEKVEAKLSGGEVETARSLVGEMLRIFVYPVGRGQKVPVEHRIKVQYLTAGKGSDPVEVVEPPVEAEAVPVVPLESEAVADQFPEAGVEDGKKIAKALTA